MKSEGDKKKVDEAVKSRVADDNKKESSIEIDIKIKVLPSQLTKLKELLSNQVFQQLAVLND
eukprot:CAMPEP_0176364156 /NCGR_PEP_ID=MMETSP0126-20121128/19597_1 /TAXON_ID=141414 ORGANISM="Strombidinopsis acuminatum, Strain SPMC142" /NCGR_SAMPLE_ID=MMETSP0126 /ASSEMBLY_ACC=CAM_ASM_000229 /LENGTH=61 /DNA_ID=CAMNT_0017720693 /DNA_START=34 /DNA_END=222 /DNA_ORIENTATION=-